MGYDHDHEGEQDPFIQNLLDELAMDAYDPPEPKADAPARPFPAPAAPVSASAEAAAHRRFEAERKRGEREQRRAAGLPDRRTVDGAVSAALAEVLRQGEAASRIKARGSAKGLIVDGEAVLRLAIKGLTARGTSKEAASRAVAERLLNR